MKLHHLRQRVLAILTSCGLLLGSSEWVSAQSAGQTQTAPAQSFVELAKRSQPGTTIVVTDANRREVRGTLTELSETSLKLLVRGEPRTFLKDDVALITQRQRDSLWNGFLIGAAAGATPAIYWRFADPNECGNSICMDDLVMGVIPSALIGLAIDAAIRKKITLFRNPNP